MFLGNIRWWLQRESQLTTELIITTSLPSSLIPPVLPIIHHHFYLLLLLLYHTSSSLPPPPTAQSQQLVYSRLLFCPLFGMAFGEQEAHTGNTVVVGRNNRDGVVRCGRDPLASLDMEVSCVFCASDRRLGSNSLLPLLVAAIVLTAGWGCDSDRSAALPFKDALPSLLGPFITLLLNI